MGLKHYLNLFKKESNIEAIKFRYFLNVFIFLVQLVFFAVFFSLRDTNITVSSVFGILALLTLMIQRILTKSFFKFVDRLIGEEPLSEEDETDAAFIAYRKGYTEFIEETKSLNRKAYPLNIASSLIIIALLPTTIILNLLGKISLAEKIFSITSIAVLVYLVLILILGVFLSRKGVWYQSYLKELTIINKFKSSNADTQIRHKFLEDKKQDKQIEYMFPEIELKKKFKRLQKAILILFLICFIVVLVAAIATAKIVEKFTESDKLIGTITGSVFGGIIALWIVALFIISFAQSKITKKQYILLKENETENALYIKLHELKTPFNKRWNILFLVCFAGEILSNILFAGIIYAITKTDSYGWIFFLLFLIEFIATFVVFFKSYGNLRFKMTDIENEIDKAKENLNKDNETKINE